ncbi:MAG: hypothetical protein JW963_26505 [Anaerolineales bacterium]|nr:hypothetical protein [Anaerolineales bacterium]
MSNQRFVLENVPRVHFYEGGKRCPEDIIIPSVIRAILEYLGEEDYGCKHCPVRGQACKVFCTYSFLVGVSGAAAFLSWKEGWHGDNMALLYMSDDAGAVERHIFEAIGYAYEAVMKEDGRDNEAVFRQRIIESLDRGMPVLGYGVIGPPEPSIITGYDEGGDVLIGWSFFQNFPEVNAGVEFEPGVAEQHGYFRKRDWFKDTENLLIIGEKQPKPSLPEVSRDALRWLIKVARTPMVRPEPDAPEWYRNRYNGLAAYAAWADHLLRDAEWPADDEATLRAHHQIHNDAIGALAEARWYGSIFLAEITEHFAAGPNHRGTAEHILHAAACYTAEHDLMWLIWDLAGGIDNPDAFRAMADPAKRRAMADIVRQARDKDAEAIQHLELALQ